MLSRPHLKVGTGQGRLYLRPQSVQRPSKIFQDTHNIVDRLVCFPRQQTIEQVCLPVAPLASLRGGCSTMSSGQYGRFICKPPLVNNLKISPKIKTIPKCLNFNGAPLLGFSHLVAPINKYESAKHSLPKDHPLYGYVQKLLGGEHAPPPRWDLICLICSGRFWRGNKFKLRPLKISSQDIKA